MKGFENFTSREQAMIEEYSEYVPSVRAETAPSGRKVYIIGTWEADYRFTTKKEFIEGIEIALKEWASEA